MVVGPEDLRVRVDRRADEVTLSRKDAKSRMRGRKPRSIGTKVRTRVGRKRPPSADLELHLEKYKRELTEAREQQTAASEVLRVISSSPGELEPVFRAMLKNAVGICGAKFGNLWLREGDTFRIAATHGAPPAYREYLHREPVVRPDPKSQLGRIARTKRAYQIADIRAAPTYGIKMRIATIELAGARTLLIVPMLKGKELVGVIAIYRQEVHAFTDRQIEVVQGFAHQAVIAIENTRLLNELRESLQQQTATSEVLSVISSSPGELEPVFQAMLGNATRICAAKFGSLVLFEGNALSARCPAQRAGAICRPASGEPTSSARRFPHP
jgi:transcriptional regulator with GAF, ATPase, and Fis domain